MVIHTVGPWHTLCQFHIGGYFQRKKSHQNEKVEFWNLAMLTTQLMTMIQSREDQRVQRECHWSVPSPARTKAIKHQMSKRRKIDKSDKTPDDRIGKNEQRKTYWLAIWLVSKPQEHLWWYFRLHAEDTYLLNRWWILWWWWRKCASCFGDWVCDGDKKWQEQRALALCGLETSHGRVDTQCSKYSCSRACCWK